MTDKKRMQARPASVGLYELYFEGGGTVPEELRSYYQSPAKAMKAAKMYFAGRRAAAPKTKTRKKIF
jgi:hypothetical protein